MGVCGGGVVHANPHYILQQWLTKISDDIRRAFYTEVYCVFSVGVIIVSLEACEADSSLLAADL